MKYKYCDNIRHRGDIRGMINPQIGSVLKGRGQRWLMTKMKYYSKYIGEYRARWGQVGCKDTIDSHELRVTRNAWCWI